MMLTFRYLLIATLPWINTGCVSDRPAPVETFSESTPAQQSLEHKLLVIQASSLFEQLSLIEKSDLNDRILIDKKIQLKKEVETKEHALLYCAYYHKEEQTKLALSCAQLANKIRSSSDSTALLSQIKKSLSQKAQKRKNYRQESAKKQRDLLMAQAQKQLGQPDYPGTINILKKLLKKFPKDKEARTLLSRTKNSQRQKVDELVLMGDQLYRNERLKEALAIWKTALGLSPDNPKITQRMDRAEKVLGSVNKLKARPESQQ